MSTRRAKSGRFDAKQIICTVIGGVFGVGLIFLVGIHIGKNVGPENIAEGATVPPTAGSMAAVTAEESGPQDYGFFELLDAPAPRRELKSIELPLNPKLEEKRHKKEAKSDEKVVKAEADASSSMKSEKKAKAKSERKEKAEQAPKDEAKAVAAAEVEDEGTKGIALVKEASDAEPMTPAKVTSERGQESVASSIGPAEQVEQALEKVAPKAKGEKQTKAAKSERKSTKEKAEKSEKQSKPKGKFTVQVSAFQDESVAATMASDLKAAGLKAYVKKESVPGRGAWYRVQVGRYQSREEAQAAQGKLKSRQGYDGFVTSN